MLYYSTNSKAKIVHSKKCDIFKRIKPKNVKKFQDLQEAHLKGFSMCTKCNPVLKEIFSKDSRCKKYFDSPNLKIEKSNDGVFVYTATDTWEIMPNSSGKFCELFHKNKNLNKDECGVPGYHRQKQIQPRSAERLLVYINKHRKRCTQKQKPQKSKGRFKSKKEVARIMYILKTIENAV